MRYVRIVNDKLDTVSYQNIHEENNHSYLLDSTHLSGYFPVWVEKYNFVLNNDNELMLSETIHKNKIEEKYVI